MSGSEESQSEFASIEEALAALRAGRMIVVVDSPDRENEGDLVMAAEKVTPAAINFMAKNARGLICVPMQAEQLQRLRIPAMTRTNTDAHGTAFHVSVDHRETSTGISAGDRALTIAALAEPLSRPEDFHQPGHIFPLAAVDGGVLRRQGHTEATIDLLGLAEMAPVGVICEISRADGEMARVRELIPFAREYRLPIVTITDLVHHRRQRARLVERASQASVPLAQGRFTAYGYRDLLDGHEHAAFVYGDIGAEHEVLVRVHSECLTGDVFGSQRCDCGVQLELALQAVVDHGCGVVVYLRGHEGRGIGLIEKLRAYDLQDRDALDTVEANLALGHPADARDYGVGMQILADLGVTRVRLLSNNPDKRVGLEIYGVEVIETVPLISPVTTENVAYLWTKQQRMGHSLNLAITSTDAAAAGMTAPGAPSGLADTRGRLPGA